MAMGRPCVTRIRAAIVCKGDAKESVEMLKEKWWLYAAGFIGLAMAFLGIGNLQGEDGGPLYGKIVAAAVAGAFAGLILGGLAVRNRNVVRGNVMIGVGVLPATLLTSILWFPPVAAVGVLSILVAWSAFVDAGKQHRSRQPLNAPS